MKSYLVDFLLHLNGEIGQRSVLIVHDVVRDAVEARVESVIDVEALVHYKLHDLVQDAGSVLEPLLGVEDMVGHLHHDRLALAEIMQLLVYAFGVGVKLGSV